MGGCGSAQMDGKKHQVGQRMREAGSEDQIASIRFQLWHFEHLAAVCSNSSTMRATDAVSLKDEVLQVAVHKNGECLAKSRRQTNRANTFCVWLQVDKEVC